MFEDQHLMAEENITLYRKLDEDKITNQELKEKMKRSGRILLVSNLNSPEKEVFELYKKREQVEKLFDDINLPYPPIDCIFRKMKLFLDMYLSRSSLFMHIASLNGL